MELITGVGVGLICGLEIGRLVYNRQMAKINAGLAALGKDLDELLAAPIESKE